MARSAAKPSPGGDGTRFADGEGQTDVAAGPAERFGIGSVIDGKYRLDALLGEGGMGAVWGAHHLQLDLPVAIKLLRRGPDMQTLSERFKLEAQAVARLVHPGIVRVFDIDATESGEPFIVMELLKGESLADLLERGRLSTVSAVQLLLPIAEALSLAHAKGIVHRDLKPPNMFLARDGERMQPKLLDFGIAKWMGPSQSTSLTETGVSVGSPDYMSPEQARGSKDVDYRADIWSFSVVLYEAVTGETPFEGDNYNALMRAIVEDEPAPLRLDENLDSGLAELILWGLSKDRSERPGSIQELGRELARWLIDRQVTEDVCGAPLGPKWITRVAQKSVRVIQVDALEAAEPAPPITDGGTLVSAQDSSAIAPQPRPATPRSGERVARRPPVWVLAAVALAVLGAGLAWGLFRSRPLEGRGLAGPTVGPASTSLVQKAPTPEPVVEMQPPAVGIASAVVEAPAVTLAKPAPSSSPRDAVHSAPVAASSQKARDSKPQPDAAKSSAAKPARDVHDETRELLQAY